MFSIARPPYFTVGLNAFRKKKIPTNPAPSMSLTPRPRPSQPATGAATRAHLFATGMAGRSHCWSRSILGQHSRRSVYRGVLGSGGKVCESRSSGPSCSALPIASRCDTLTGSRSLRRRLTAHGSSRHFQASKSPDRTRRQAARRGTVRDES